MSHSFTPPATRQEVEAWYPGAVVKEDVPPVPQVPQVKTESEK
jgi:hypothetical protein